LVRGTLVVVVATVVLIAAASVGWAETVPPGGQARHGNIVIRNTGPNPINYTVNPNPPPVLTIEIENLDECEIDNPDAMPITVNINGTGASVVINGHAATVNYNGSAGAPYSTGGTTYTGNSVTIFGNGATVNYNGTSQQNTTIVNGNTPTTTYNNSASGNTTHVNTNPVGNGPSSVTTYNGNSTNNTTHVSGGTQAHVSNNNAANNEPQETPPGSGHWQPGNGNVTTSNGAPVRGS